MSPLRAQDSYAEFKKRVLFVVIAVTAAIAALVAIWQAKVILLVLFAGFLGALVLVS